MATSRNSSPRSRRTRRLEPRRRPLLRFVPLVACRDCHYLQSRTDSWARPPTLRSVRFAAGLRHSAKPIPRTTSLPNPVRIVLTAEKMKQLIRASRVLVASSVSLVFVQCVSSPRDGDTVNATNQVQHFE